MDLSRAITRKVLQTAWGETSCLIILPWEKMLLPGRILECQKEVLSSSLFPNTAGFLGGGKTQARRKKLCLYED